MRSQELAKDYKELQRLININKMEKTELEEKKAALETLLVDTMDNEGLENFRTEDGMFYQYGDVNVSFGPKEESEGNKALFYAWLREHDLQDVIKTVESVHHMTVKTIVKDHGVALPGIVKADFITKIGVRK